MHERRFNRNIEFLRDPERMELLEVQRVVDLSMEKLDHASSVLDVGTGSGIFAEEFDRRGLRVSGVDVNPEMVETAGEFVPRAEFKEGIAERLPYPDRSFDLVFMGLLLHETDDPLAALKEAKRVSRQRLAVLEWKYEEQPFGPPVADRLSASRIDELARAAGWTNVEVRPLANLVLYLLNHPG